MNKEKINIPIEKLMEREKVAIFQAKKKRRVGGTIKHTFLVACIRALYSRLKLCFYRNGGSIDEYPFSWLDL